MKGSNLTKLEDFVLEVCTKKTQTHTEMSVLNWDRTTQLAELLKSKPELGHFVPCDEDGKPMEKPYGFGGYMIDEYDYAYTKGEREEYAAYQQALDRVLWEGEWSVYTNLGVIDSNDRYVYIDQSEETYADLTEIGLVFKKEL